MSWLSKPEPRKRVKARAKRVVAAKRKAARMAALERAGWHCERCRRSISDDLPEWHSNRAHVNERVPKSRGGSATELSNLEALCQQCHLPNGRHAPTAERQALILNNTKVK